MTLTEFLDKRKEQKFTATEVMYFLRERKYCFRLIDTCLKHNPGYGKNIGWERGEKSNFIKSLKTLGIPNHFAYIKFYADKDYEESADDAANHIFALVAGLSHYSETYRTDIKFYEKGAGKAKKWFSDHQSEYLWYMEKLLIVWSSDGKEPEDVEKDIGGLFGLFSS